MISPELLRRHPFFGFLNDSELKAIAMISEEVTYKDKTVITEPNQPADYLYFLMAGNGSNYFIVDQREGYKELYAGEVNPGEMFGISSLIEPYIHTLSVQANGEVKAIKINAKALREACQADTNLGFHFMKAIAGILMYRLSGAMAQIAVVK
jgi:CRP-like cAMP-binding protein